MGAFFDWFGRYSQTGYRKENETLHAISRKYLKDVVLFAEELSTWFANRVRTEMHVDAKNQGPSLAYGLGRFTGGQLSRFAAASAGLVSSLTCLTRSLDHPGLAAMLSLLISL